MRKYLDFNLYLIKMYLAPLAFLLGVIFSREGLASDNSKDPFSVLPFVPPASIAEIDSDYRSSWVRLSGFELSGLHWNQFVVVYTNTGAKTYRKNFLEFLKALDAEEEDEDYSPKFVDYPVGTVVLKENYLSGEGKPGKPTTLTMMIKRKKGYSPESGDWEYLESDIKGNILIRGPADNEKVKARCSACHENMESRDYIFSTYFTDFKVNR